MFDALLVDSASRSDRRFNMILAVTTGFLLGLAFPPLSFYSVAYVALIPLLFLLERLQTIRQVIRYSYLAMFVFNALALHWVGGFTHMRDGYLMLSGIALLLVHPMFFWIPILPAAWVRRRLGSAAFLASFPLLWVGFEYFHSLSEYSFPWITIGNSQAYDLYRSQIAEFTSVYGLSFLIVVFNVLAYLFISKFALKEWTFSSNSARIVGAVLILVYFVPSFYGSSRIGSYDRSAKGRQLNVGIVQPNIDPFEKWGDGNSRWDAYNSQVQLLLQETRNLSKDSLDLVVWPETAIPFYVLLPQNSNHWNEIKHEIDFANTPVFTGIPDGEYYDSTNAPATSEWIERSGLFFEGYNAATLIEPYSPPGKVYRKVLLVPFAERVPYAETFKFLIEPLKWGVGISGWGKGTDQVVYHLKTRDGDTASFSGMICYESIYPDYVRRFVHGGANFLVIVTNDSWWGNTSGAYQHAAYASLRAIENRRWIIRCANGGVSGFVDPVGRYYNTTEMYTRATLKGAIEARRDETFYSRHGDIFGIGCLLLSVGLIVFAGLKRERHHG